MKLLVEQGGNVHIGFSYTRPEFDTSILAIDLYGRQVAEGTVNLSAEDVAAHKSLAAVAKQHLEEQPTVVAPIVHDTLAKLYLPYLIRIEGHSRMVSPYTLQYTLGLSHARLQQGARVARGMLRPVYPVEVVPRATTRHHTVETRG